MKKIFLLVALMLMGCNLLFAQSNQPTKYRRSSLYTMMIPDKDLTPDGKQIILNTFDKMPMPDKYNDHNLELRNAEGIYKIEVTAEEIQKMDGQAVKKTSKFGAFAKKTVSTTTEVVTGKEQNTISDNEYVARIMKMFEQEKVAHKMVSKWFDLSNVTLNGLNGGKSIEMQAIDFNLISERGLYSAGEEEKAVAAQTKSGMNKIQDAAAGELMPKTFVLVTRYSYLPAEEIIEMVAGPATMAAAKKGGLAAIAATKTIEQLQKSIKGYFVKTSSYLFKMKWNEELQAKIQNGVEDGGFILNIEDYKNKYDISAMPNDKFAFDYKAFMECKDFQMEYVGKTWCYAPATLQITTKADADVALIERATVRATDKAIAQLQKKYNEFRAFTPLQVDEEGNCYAYIGLKEGVKAGDKFDVIMPQINKEGKTEYKKIASLKALDGKVWDNRFGADKQIEGQQEEKTAAADLKYTSLSKNKKVMSGMLLKQAK